MAEVTRALPALALRLATANGSSCSPQDACSRTCDEVAGRCSTATRVPLAAACAPRAKRRQRRGDLPELLPLRARLLRQAETAGIGCRGCSPEHPPSSRPRSSIAPRHEVCPFKVSLDLAHQVQVVVCDLQHTPSTLCRAHEFGRQGTSPTPCLVKNDEVHNLVERRRGYYSPSLSARQAREAAEQVARLADPALAELVEVTLDLAQLIEGGGRRAPATGPSRRGAPQASRGAVPEKRSAVRPALRRRLRRLSSSGSATIGLPATTIRSSRSTSTVLRFLDR